MVSFRMWVPRRKGRADLHFSSAAIQANSVVHISVAEAVPFPEGLLGQVVPLAHFGAASITLQNVRVRQGAVDFNVLVDWPDPLNIVTDITILDPPTQLIRGT
jgi:hypothetical protein